MRLLFMAELYAIVNFPKMFIVLVDFGSSRSDMPVCCNQRRDLVYETKYARREEQYESIFKSEKASYLMLQKIF